MLTVALSVLLLATETAAPAPQQPATAISQPAEAQKAEKKICKREQSTGSRMDSKRICLTAAQWKEHEQEARDNVADMQRRTTIPQ